MTVHEDDLDVSTLDDLDGTVRTPGAGPFGRTALAYLEAGWAPLPLPFGQKAPVPVGFTGFRPGSRYPGHDDVTSWAREERSDRGGGNVGLRMPIVEVDGTEFDVVDLDVDSYAGKVGATTWAAYLEAYGPVPATWSLHSRLGDPDSRHRLFLAPAGLSWPSHLPPVPGTRHGDGGVDVVRPGHRYAVAAPSVRTDVPQGEEPRLTRWVRPDGTLAAEGEFPRPQDLPLLPRAWVEGITRGEADERHPSTPAGDAPVTPAPAPEPVADRAAQGPQEWATERLRAARQRLQALQAATVTADQLLRGEYRGEPWDATTYEIAKELLALANTGHATREQVRAVFFEHCPTDREGFGPGKVEYQWARALEQVGTDVPWDMPLSVFTPSSVGGDPSTSLTGTEQQAGETGEARVELAIAQELERLHVRAEAARRFAALRATPFDSTDLDEGVFSGEESEAETRWRFEGMLAAQGRALLVAQRKAGKTTTAMNVVRAVLTGEPLFGRFATVPLAPGERVMFLNYEVSGDQARRWLREAGIPAGRVWLVNLRGQVNPLATAEGRSWLVEKAREHNCRFAVVDPFGRAFTGKNQDDNSEVGPFLSEALDGVLTRAGIVEVLLVAHAGWAAADRSRGASALEDWPDAIWRLTKDADNGVRRLSAEGRDIEVEQRPLRYDAEARTLVFDAEGMTGKQERRQDRHWELLTAHMLPALADGDPEGTGMAWADLRKRLNEGRRDGEGVAWASGAPGAARNLGVSGGYLQAVSGDRGRLTVWLTAPGLDLLRTAHVHGRDWPDVRIGDGGTSLIVDPSPELDWDRDPAERHTA